MKYKKASQTKLDGIPLAVVSKGSEVYMLLRIDTKTTTKLEFLKSSNGVDFVSDKKKVHIKNLSGKVEKIKICERFSISKTPNGYVMTYVRHGTGKMKGVLVVSKSLDLYNWSAKSELPVDEFHHTAVTYDKKRDAFDLFRDGLFIKHQSTVSIASWKERPSLLFTSRAGMFDRDKLSIIGVGQAEEGIVLLYDASQEYKGKTLLQAGAVILDRKDPKKIIWRSTLPLWQGIVESSKKEIPVDPLGFIILHGEFLLYWVTADKNLIVVKAPRLFKEVHDARYHPKILDRHHANPIIEPRYEHEWEGEGTFNPAVVEDDEGIIHLLYRAVGRDGISRVGYAKSKNGTYFTKRSPLPVFVPEGGYGMPDPLTYKGHQGYFPCIYTSGGGWGGAEDPRLVKIDGRVYMTYVAFEGWGSMRIALTSISLEDFKAGRWTWKKPQLISPPNVMAKNWLIFPEKINGKFAVLHGIAPHIMVDYVDDLDNFKGYIYSKRPEGAPVTTKRKTWDSIMRGAGPTPLNTDLGWLILFHAVDATDSSRYKLGAMILDKNDPTKVLYRSQHPILAPDMHYENNGKPGVVYASGAIIRDDELYVYYGGADKVCCMAKTSLSKLLKYLQTGDVKPYMLDKAEEKKKRAAAKKKAKSKADSTKVSSSRRKKVTNKKKTTKKKK